MDNPFPDDAKDPIYNKIDPSVVGNPDPTSTTKSAKQYVTSIVASISQIPDDASLNIYTEKVQRAVLPLEATDRQKEQQRKKRKPAKTLAQKLIKQSAKERRALRLYELESKAQKFELYLPLHELWEEYMNELWGQVTPALFSQKLLRADLHGCLLKGNIRFSAIVYFQG
jgi:hypothetical protein